MQDVDPTEVIDAVTETFGIDDPPSENPNPSAFSSINFYLTKEDKLRLDLLSLKIDVSRQDLLTRALDILFIAHGYPKTGRVDV